MLCPSCKKYSGKTDDEWKEKIQKEKLIKASTYDIDITFRKYAKTTNDPVLSAKLATALDIHAMDGYYHKSCSTDLYHRARSVTRQILSQESDTKFRSHEAMAFSQLVAYVGESPTDIYKLRDLVELYKQKLIELGCTDTTSVHSTRLKERLLDKIPGLEAQPHGRDILLTTRETVASVLADAHKTSLCDDDAIHIVSTVEIMRKFILANPEEQCPDPLSEDTLKRYCSHPLHVFLRMVMEWTRCQKLIGHGQGARAKVACTVTNAIILNTVKHVASQASKDIRHQHERETPAPVYVGMKLQNAGAGKSVIQSFASIGLSVSYDRITEISTYLATRVSEQFRQDGVVVPPNMRRFVFTTADVDNINEIVRSTLGQSDLDGTMISFTNHLTPDNEGLKRELCQVHCDTDTDRKNISLPDSYTIVPPIELTNSDIYLTPSDNPYMPGTTHIPGAITKTEAWLKHASTLVNREEDLTKGDMCSFSGFNASLIPPESMRPRAEIGICPLFLEKAQSPSMMKHAMIIAKDGIAFLNPGQTPVLGADQPLYSILKQLQWQFPDSGLGEDSFFVMMGGLHIEMAFQEMLGKWLGGSGWDVKLSEAGVFTAGRAHSALGASNVKRTRYAHDVTCVALYILREEAYQEDTREATNISREAWCSALKVHPQFLYWNDTLELEMLYNRFIQSQREGNLDLYIEVLGEIIPCFFTFNHSNYARWLPVHVRDLVNLQAQHPDLYAEFQKGNFVVQRSDARYSLMAKDQSHEHLNNEIKHSGGYSSLNSDDPTTLLIQILASPQRAELIKKFEAGMLMHTDMEERTHYQHHEEGHAFQVRFNAHVKMLLEVLRPTNPFKDRSPHLSTLHSKVVMDVAVVNCMRDWRLIGQVLYSEYAKSRFKEGSKAITDTIHRNNMATFQKGQEKPKKEVQTLKQNAALVAQVFLAIQSRPEADLGEFFQYENQKEPPSLANNAGHLRIGQKSDLLKCLPIKVHDKPSGVTVKIYDGPAMAHIIQPGQSIRTIGGYIEKLPIPYVKGQAEDSVSRMDWIWDVYPETSLKQQAHLNRGDGVAKKVTADTPINAKEWNSMLRNEDTKKDIYTFISMQLRDQNYGPGVCLYTTVADMVITSIALDAEDLRTIAPCNHQEADTRMILHLKHASTNGHEKAMIRTVDTDVIVLATSAFHDLGLSELWVSFGTKKNHRYIAIHDLSMTLGPDTSSVLPLFHALSGCDTTSQFFGIGKKTAWKVWQRFPDLTTVLKAIKADPCVLTIDSDHMAALERFVVLLYSESCTASHVNQARQELFSKGARALDSIPPTQAALFQHLKRCLLQGAYIWGQVLQRCQEIPDYEDWGWVKVVRAAVGNQLVPFWTTLSDVSKGCSILTRCGCKKSCTGNCKCSKANLHCTTLCHCQGTCCNNDT